MFFPSAKIIIKHPTDKTKFLVVKRGNFYEPAGGKVEIDFHNRTSETLEECAIREAQEELGVHVKIERYLGSYYFFWSIDNAKASSCAVFMGSIIEIDKTFTTNKDTCELTIIPEWVSIDVIKSSINPEYIGLQNIFDGIIQSYNPSS